MTEYMLKKPYYIGEDARLPGTIFDIKKLKHPIKLDSGAVYEYMISEEDALLSKKHLKENFTKGSYKAETPKQILKLLLTLALYELSKEVTYEIICRMQANDMVPKDYEVSE
ncbi:transcriptional activator RinB [Staphylococcus cohnii]|uniref:transcriptional activator RinB n=1 Tax=Staphylococcus cohnii TaxID=29382 RepID=UPI003CFAC5AC